MPILAITDNNRNSLIMRITGNDITKFFNEKGCKEGCLYCGSDSWIIPSNDSGLEDVKEAEDDEDLAPILAKHPLSALDGEPTTQTLRVLYLICSNCGFIRGQDSLALMNWMKSRKPSRKSLDDGDDE